MHCTRATPRPGVVSGLVPNSLWRTIIRDTCAAMRRKRIRRCVCISVSLVCLLCLILWTSTAHTILHYLDCSDYHSKVYLEELVRTPQGLGEVGLLSTHCITLSYSVRTTAMVGSLAACANHFVLQRQSSFSDALDMVSNCMCYRQFGMEILSLLSHPRHSVAALLKFTWKTLVKT